MCLLDPVEGGLNISLHLRVPSVTCNANKKEKIYCLIPQLLPIVKPRLNGPGPGEDMIDCSRDGVHTALTKNKTANDDLAEIGGRRGRGGRGGSEGGCLEDRL